MVIVLVGKTRKIVAHTLLKLTFNFVYRYVTTELFSYKNDRLI